MKLLAKFNLIFIVVFGLGLLATGYVARTFLEGNARDQVLQQARLMMETSGAARNYTSKQIRPLLEVRHRREEVFYPQSVPAFSAGQMFAYLRTNYADYAYKEATLNPTNLEDRAVDWEADLIGQFRKNPALPELTGERETPTGKSLFLAKPIKAVATCQECHSVPAAAPRAMVKLYGPNNGFGWKLNDIVAAQIVSVPLSIPVAIAERAFRGLMLWMFGITVLSLVLLNLALVATVIRPVSAMSAAADQISRGNLDVPELPVSGKDEIAVLADSFNRMHRSLSKAMKMLEG